MELQDKKKVSWWLSSLCSCAFCHRAAELFTEQMEPLGLSVQNNEYAAVYHRIMLLHFFVVVLLRGKLINY